jgi:hypothetical protein
MKTFYESISGIHSLLYSLAIVITLVSSNYVNAQTSPTVSTAIASNITATTATSGGNVTSNGGASVTARGVCWSTTSNPTIANSLTSDGTGTGPFTSTITGLTTNTLYYLRAYATNTVGIAYGNEVTFTTLNNNACPGIETITINHVVGTVAPVTKTVTYGTVTNIPGEPTKCWITSNLGSDHQATAVSDASEASAGWYWQFNRKQGYKHDGANRTPNNAWVNSIVETYDWQAANDPCTIEIGSGWRIPSVTELTNVDASGNWNDWNGPWNSGLKLHAAGGLYYTSGELSYRGSGGTYWSSTQTSAVYGWYLNFAIGYSVMTSYEKAYGYPLRCIKDCITYSNVSVIINASANSVCAGNSVTFTASPTNGGTNPVYQWKVNGSNAGSNNQVYTYNPVNGDIVTCVLSSNLTCVSGNPATSNSITMTILITPVPSITTNSPVCVGGELHLTGAPAGMSNYIWTGPDGFWANIPYPLIILNNIGLANAGTYTLTVTAPNGCTAMTSTQVDVSPTSIGGSVSGGTTVPEGINNTLLTLSGHTGTVQRWESSLNGSTWILAETTNSTTFSAINLVVTTYYRAVVKNGGCSEVFSSVATVTVQNIPTVTTAPVTSITHITANSGGNVSSDGGVTVTARGVCWSTSQNPTVVGNHTTDGTGTGTFLSNLTGLTANTLYYVRAYATNSIGTTYGSQLSFTTSRLIQVTSPNGNEIWLSGTAHSITWTSNDVVNVKIEYSIDNGANWITIISDTPATPGSYPWTVPDPNPNSLSVSCQVKITSTTNSSVFDLSDATFTILNVLKHAPITYSDTIEANNPADIAVPVNVDQFKKITGISLRLDYNPAVLTFTGWSNINAALGGLFVNSSSVSPTLNKVIIVWSGSDPVTLADGSKVVDILFTHTSGATTLVWNNNSNGGQDCEYADSIGNPLADIPTTLFYRNGEVHSAPGWQLNGTLLYNNSAVTPLDNVKIVLFQNTQRLDSVTTNSLGYFQFNQKQNGTYIIKPYTNKPWAGVNSTDAVKIQRHFTGLELLTEPVRLLAGDVNLSNFINTTDAVKVKRRFASLDNSFARGDWTFAKPTTGGDTVIVNGANLTQNFYGLCVGDVNGSNIPGTGAKSKGLLALEQNTLILAVPDEVVQIPINVPRDVQIGAISMVIGYPDHLMRIKEVRAPHGTPFYTAGMGNLRLAWSETQPLMLARGDTMMTLVVQVSTQFTTSDRITLSLTNESEIADLHGIVFNDLILNAPVLIHKGTNGFNTPPVSETRFVVYPVPNDGIFTASITSSFTQTFDIMIYNKLGQLICEKKEITVSGTRDQQFDLRPLENGIYSVILRGRREVIAREILINH